MKHKFSIPCAKKHLKEVRTVLSERLESVPLNARQKHKIILAIDEACSNAIIHGNHCDRNQRLWIELKVNHKKLTVQIYDTGLTEMKTESRAHFNLKKSISKKQKGGLGLHLMHLIMDDISYFVKGGRHICSLSKNLA